MSPVVPIWSRDSYVPTDAVAAVLLLAFGRSPVVTDKPVSMDQYGIPGEAALKFAKVSVVPREMNPEWFDNWKRDGIRALAATQLGADVHKLDDAQSLHMVRVELPDPPDLAYLQAAWGLARWLVDCGAELVFDAHAARFRTRDEVQAFAPARPLDVSEEVTVIFETNARSKSGLRFMHTRGMIKFARPDILLRADDLNNVADGQVISDMAKSLAAGRVVRDGQRVYVGERRYVARAYRPAPDDDVNLNNEGILLEPAVRAT